MNKIELSALKFFRQYINKKISFNDFCNKKEYIKMIDIKNIEFKHKLIKNLKNKNEKYIHISEVESLLNSIFDYIEEKCNFGNTSICFKVEHIDENTSNLNVWIDEED